MFAARAPGQSLDEPTREFMQTQLGHDFSRVRIHADPAAAQSARALNAHAYTAGTDIVFAQGRYAPHSREGRMLLAHELTHVAQQESSGPRVQFRLADVAARGGPKEREADRAAERVAGAGSEAEFESDFANVISILDETHYSDDDEGAVIAVLRKWAGRREAGKNWLDEFFTRLTGKQKTLGVVTDEVTSYYSLIFNHFDRVDEVRKIRDAGSRRFACDEGVAEVSAVDELKGGQWKKNAEEFWSEKAKRVGEKLRRIGAPVLVQNLLGGVTGVIQGFAELAVELAEGVMSLAELVVNLTGSVLYVLTGAADEIGFGNLKTIPYVGRVFDPETYRGRYEATAGFFAAAKQAFDDPGKVWAGVKDAASKAWDEAMLEYDVADEFNKSRIIARTVVKVGMAVGQAIKDLPKLASKVTKIAASVGAAVVKVSHTIAKALRGAFAVGKKVFRGTWKIIEDTLENGGKRLRYFFQRSGAKVADEIPAVHAEEFVHCSVCDITPEGRRLREAAEAKKLPGVDADIDASVERAFVEHPGGPAPDLRPAPKAGAFAASHVEKLTSFLAKTLADAPAGLGKLWDDAKNVGDVLKLTKENARHLFDLHRRRFWGAVQDNPAAKKLFEEAGCIWGNRGTAPVYKLPDGRQIRMSIDHIVERQQDFTRALDESNLRIVFERENTVLLRLINKLDPFQ